MIGAFCISSEFTFHHSNAEGRLTSFEHVPCVSLCDSGLRQRAVVMPVTRVSTSQLTVVSTCVQHCSSQAQTTPCQIVTSSQAPQPPIPVKRGCILLLCEADFLYYFM